MRVSFSPPLPLVSAAGAETGFFSFSPPPSPDSVFSVPGAGLECHSRAPGLSLSQAERRIARARASASAVRALTTASVPDRRNCDRASVQYQQASALGLSEACSTLAVLWIDCFV